MIEKQKLRIVFMGTPDFAVPSLNILIENGYDVCAVITAPDKPAGRGKKLQSSPVKKAAEAHDIPVLQPTNLKSPEFNRELSALGANLFIVVAFRMLPEMVWNMPEIGTFNLHASLLPDYRGAAPINWAIINGEKETGASTFFLKHEIDTGDILLQSKLPITDGMTAGELHDRLMIDGAELVLETVKGIETNSLTPQAQVISGEPKHAPKIFKEDMIIDWDQETKSVNDFIRGLSPYPCAQALINEKYFKIPGARISERTDITDPGTIWSDGKQKLEIATKDGWIEVLEIQAPGKKRMSTLDFLNGNGLSLLEPPLL